MMSGFWNASLAIAGLGSIATFFIWSLYKNWLNLPIFQVLTKNQQYKLFIIFLVLTFLFSISALAAYVYLAKNDSQEKRFSQGKLLLFDEPREVDLLGYKFTNHIGNRINLGAEAFEYKLIYFSYTRSPCRSRPEVMTIVKEELSHYISVEAYLISIDTEYDSYELLHKYVDGFRFNVTGLTGDPEKIRSLADSLSIVYRRESSLDSAEGYSYGHTETVAVIQNNKYIGFFLPSSNAEYMTESLLNRAMEGERWQLFSIFFPSANAAANNEFSSKVGSILDRVRSRDQQRKYVHCDDVILHGK